MLLKLDPRVPHICFCITTRSFFPRVHLCLRRFVILHRAWTALTSSCRRCRRRTSGHPSQGRRGRTQRQWKSSLHWVWTKAGEADGRLAAKTDNGRGRVLRVGGLLWPAGRHAPSAPISDRGLAQQRRVYPAQHHWGRARFSTIPRHSAAVDSRAKQTCPIFGTSPGRKCTFYPHVCSECRLGHRAPCLTPRPIEAYPGRKNNKMTKKCTGDKPRPLPGAEPARWVRG